MNHGIAYVPPLYWPVAIWPEKKALVSGWNLARFASQPDRANWGGQMTSDVITSGVLDPAMKRCVSCWNATSAVGERDRTDTVMFGCSFSNAFTAACVAVPSEPRPWVAKTMVCLALAATWLLAAGVLPLLPQAAAARASVPAAATMPRVLLDLYVGHNRIVATSFCCGRVFWSPVPDNVGELRGQLGDRRAG